MPRHGQCSDADPDGVWRVELDLRPRSRSSLWYRLVDPVHDNVIEDLSIAGVERLLARMGYDLADLVDVPAPGLAARGLVRDRCGETGQLCPDKKKGRRCPGWHLRWVPQRMNNLVVRAAYGEWVPYDHRTSRNGTQWFWVRRPGRALKYQLSATVRRWSTRHAARRRSPRGPRGDEPRGIPEGGR